mmetsp:Transcript_89227/g.257287  ORF Transcript_89227/g.257287 Transcript_89227/m.257287 type:complete len:257 (-) Transcript_89227:654-1424(-)
MRWRAWAPRRRRRSTTGRWGAAMAAWAGNPGHDTIGTPTTRRWRRSLRPTRRSSTGTIVSGRASAAPRRGLSCARRPSCRVPAATATRRWTPCAQTPRGASASAATALSPRGDRGWRTSRARPTLVQATTTRRRRPSAGAAMRRAQLPSRSRRPRILSCGQRGRRQGPGTTSGLTTPCLLVVRSDRRTSPSPGTHTASGQRRRGPREVRMVKRRRSAPWWRHRAPPHCLRGRGRSRERPRPRRLARRLTARRAAID